MSKRCVKKPPVSKLLGVQICFRGGISGNIYIYYDLDDIKLLRQGLSFKLWIVADLREGNL